MTQQEFEEKKRQLRTEYAAKSGDINRKKDAVRMQMAQRMEFERNTFYNDKERHLDDIDCKLRELSLIEKGSQKAISKQMEIKVIENKLSRLKTKYYNKLHTHKAAALEQRIALDEDSRQLSAWYAGELAKLAREFKESGENVECRM